MGFCYPVHKVNECGTKTYTFITLLQYFTKWRDLPKLVVWHVFDPEHVIFFECVHIFSSKKSNGSLLFPQRFPFILPCALFQINENILLNASDPCVDLTSYSHEFVIFVIAENGEFQDEYEPREFPFTLNHRTISRWSLT